jgi:hypothetical protein
VFPPFTDCGSHLIALTQYVYSVVAVNGFLAEGAMISSVVTTAALSVPDPVLSVTLEKSTINWLNVTVTPACDAGGANPATYRYVVEQTNGGLSRSATFACCIFILDGLDPNEEYFVSVRVSNGAGASPWLTQMYSTRLGIPLTPVVELTRANTYSLVLEIVPPVPMDNEITAYEIVATLDNTHVHSGLLTCNIPAGPGGQFGCQRAYRISSLAPETAYDISVRAIGPLGVSTWFSGQFTTSNEFPGTLFVS